MSTIAKSPSSKFIILQIVLLHILATFMAGCSVSPKHITFEERHDRVLDDWTAIFKQQDKMPEKLSLEVAMARALKYNLDMKIQNYAALLSQDKLDVANYDMWPDLLGSLGYVSRSNFNATNSANADTGAISDANTTSQDKTRRTAGLQFSWNLLDFGVSYITAKQSADQYLIALQRHRKTMQNVMSDVRYNYWKAYTAQEVEKDLIPLFDEVREAINSSKAASEEKLAPELDSLNYRRSLYDILRNLTELQKNLVEAKANLATLTLIPPSTEFELLPESSIKPPLPKEFPMELPLLEKVALYDRPELQEADYLKRISSEEISKARLQMLPGISLSYGKNYDSNSFLVNRNWAEAGAQLSWNLLKVFSGPASIREAKSNKALVDLQRMALGVVVMTQVDVAYFRYHEALDEFEVNKRMFAVDSNIRNYMIQQYNEGTTDQLSLIRAKANRILAKLRFNLAYAEWQNAGGQLLSSIGYDIAGGINTKASIDDISQDIKLALAKTPNITNMIAAIADIPGFNKTYREEYQVKSATGLPLEKFTKLSDVIKSRQAAPVAPAAPAVPTAPAPQDSDAGSSALNPQDGSSSSPVPADQTGDQITTPNSAEPTAEPTNIPLPNSDLPDEELNEEEYLLPQVSQPRKNSDLVNLFTEHRPSATKSHPRSRYAVRKSHGAHNKLASAAAKAKKLKELSVALQEFKSDISFLATDVEDQINLLDKIVTSYNKGVNLHKIKKQIAELNSTNKSRKELLPKNITAEQTINAYKRIASSYSKEPDNEPTSNDVSKINRIKQQLKKN